MWMSVAVDSLKLIFCWHKLLSCTEVLVRPERSSKKKWKEKETIHDPVPKYITHVQLFAYKCNPVRENNFMRSSLIRIFRGSPTEYRTRVFSTAINIETMLHASCSGVHVIRSFVSSLIFDGLDDIESSFRVGVRRTDSSSWPRIVVVEWTMKKKKKKIYSDIDCSFLFARYSVVTIGKWIHGDRVKMTSNWISKESDWYEPNIILSEFFLSYFKMIKSNELYTNI